MLGSAYFLQMGYTQYLNQKQYIKYMNNIFIYL